MVVEVFTPAVYNLPYAAGKVTLKGHVLALTWAPLCYGTLASPFLQSRLIGNKYNMA